MSILQKIIAWILVFTTVISVLSVPAFAVADPEPTDSRGSFYDWVINNGGSFSAGNGGSFGGRYSKDHYDDFLSGLPATGITSAGSLIWWPTFKDVTDLCYLSSPSWHTGAKVSSDLYDESANVISFSFAQSDRFLGICASIAFPFSGSFRELGTSSCEGTGVSANGSVIPFSVYWDANPSFVYRGDGKTSDYHIFPSLPSGLSSYSVVHVKYILPVFEVIPDTALSGDTYNINSRPTTITGGNYGIVGDDGTINTITNNNQIVNETNNTYYNPATGQTSTITDWSYNYEDRSYTLTLESGDTTTVIYGDENITIKEGDTVYNIYYIVDGVGSEPHVHEWYQTGGKQGNCVTPAQRTYTCAICGEQYTETDPVLDHSWRIIQTVSTKYDENGNLLQEGYTIYECERCGEQYRATNDTGPPSSGADSTGPPDGDINDGGLIEWLNGLVKSLSDNLSGVVGLLLRFFEEIPKLFGGFLDFLSAIFPFLPDEIMLLLTFGIAAVVFVGIIKAIRR